MFFLKQNTCNMALNMLLLGKYFSSIYNIMLNGIIKEALLWGSLKISL